MMHANRTMAVHSLIRAALLFGFAFYIVYLTKSGHMLYYIAPRMTLYVKLAAIVLYAVAAYQLFASYRQFRGHRAAECDCGHAPTGSAAKHTLVYALFAVPLLLGFLTPDANLGSALAAKKGMTLSGSAASAKQSAAGGAGGGGQAGAAAAGGAGGGGQAGAAAAGGAGSGGQAGAAAAASPSPAAASPSASPAASPLPAGGAVTDAQLDALFKADKYTEDFARLGKKLYKQDSIQVKDEGFIETLSSIDLFQDNFLGKKIEISGFVYREDAMKTNEFVVARFQVQCCSADASPFGTMVTFDRAASFPADTWVKVTGTLGKTTYQGNEIMKIDAAKVEKVPAPENRYVYPNYDYLMQQ